MIHQTRIKDLHPVDGTLDGVALLQTEYENLLMNAVTIEGLEYQEETFVKQALIELGQIGYDKITKKFYYVYGSGINDYGNPSNLRFRTVNGKTFSRKAYYEDKPNGAYIINALPIDFTLGGLIERTCKFIENCNVAINQNIDACKTPYIVVCKNEDLMLSIKHAVQQKEKGQAVLIVSDELGDALKSVDINTEYLADRFIEIRDIERDKLLNKLGIMSANINKRERVQVGEVNATVGQCSDYIYLLIDTFNKQMETYGLPFEMKINGSLEELYEDDTEEDEEDNVIEEKEVEEHD